MTTDDYSIQLLPIASTKDATLDILADQAVAEDKAVVETTEPTETIETVTDLYDNESEAVTSVTYSVGDDVKDAVIEYEYSAESDGLKENIIINEPTEVNPFEFLLSIDNCYAKLNESGAVMLYDNETDEEIGYLPAPCVTDAASEETKSEGYSESVYYTLEETSEGEYILTLTVTEEYLNDEDRVYPVTIDPSVSLTGSSTVYDTYVMSNGYASYNFYTSSVMVMRCGYSSKMSSLSRTYVQFSDIAEHYFRESCNRATFNFYESSAWTPYPTITIERVTGSWSPSSITWNNKPSSTSCSAGTSAVTSTSSFHSINVTKLVSQWANGTYSNYGLVLRATVESSSVANRVDLFGSGQPPHHIGPIFL